MKVLKSIYILICFILGLAIALIHVTAITIGLLSCGIIKITK